MFWYFDNISNPYKKYAKVDIKSIWYAHNYASESRYLCISRAIFSVLEMPGQNVLVKSDISIFGRI